MKKLFISIVIILAFASIIAGKIHWDNKIEAAGNVVKPEITIEKSERGKRTEDTTEQVTKEDILKYTKNLPEEIVEKIENAIDSKEPVHLAIMGSAATSSNPTGWPALLKKELENTYGVEIFDISIKEIPNTTSTEVVTNKLYQDVIDREPDILLLEPFILYDNGAVIPLSNRLANLTTLLTDFETQLPNLSIIIQPANPLHNATFYPGEVNGLKDFVEKSGYLYLNHWEAWPDPTSPEMADHLIDGEGMPNELGHQVWAGYLKEFFISAE